MNNRQLELGLGQARGCRSANLRHRRSRSHQWFDRMRQVVEDAMDPEAPRPSATESQRSRLPANLR